MVRSFLQNTGMSEAEIERVAFLVGHHHTYTEIDGQDYQILLEADYMANASENGYPRENIENFMKRIMKMESGIRLTRALFCV